MSAFGPRGVLLITDSFPPIGKPGSSIRVVKHIKYLQHLDWQFNVVASDRSQYEPPDLDHHVLLDDVPSDVRVYRTRAWRIPTGWTSRVDLTSSSGQVREQRSGPSFFQLGRASKALLHKARLSRFIFPDSYAPWVLTSVPVAVRVAKRHKVGVIYAVAPPLSALVIGLLVALVVSRPLVVDYKDDRVGTGDYSALPFFLQRLHLMLERILVQRSRYVVCVTPSSLACFRERHPKQDPAKFVLIPNGADLEEYQFLTDKTPTRQVWDNSKFVIVNAGGYSPHYRNAKTFLRAVGSLISKRPEFRDVVRIKFIGEGAYSFYGDLLQRENIGDLFEEIPVMGRQKFVTTLHSANLLLLIQTLGYPTSVAGTFYEYWAAGQAPILVVGEPGDMWDMLRTHELGFAVAYDDVTGISCAIERLVEAHLTGNPARISTDGIERYDRRYLAEQLADILNKATKS